MADAQCDNSGISKSAERASVFGEENTRSLHEGDYLLSELSRNL